jgi:putative ABC transport system permease protein
MNNFLRQFRTKPLRFLLTLIQIVVGSLAMMVALSALFSVGQNTLNLERFDLIAGTRGENEQSYFIFNNQALSQLKTISPDVEYISLYSTDWGNTKVQYNSRLYEFTKSAYVDRNYFNVSSVELTRGSLFTSEDKETFAAVLVISDSSAQILFGDEVPIGKTLEVFFENSEGVKAPEPYKVVGTFAETNNLNQIYIYLPYWKLAANQESGTLAVLAKKGRGVEARGQVVSAAKRTYGSVVNGLASEFGFEVDKMFYTRSTDDDLTLVNVVLVIFSFFGAVACVVGVIGIASIMVVNALERKRDIGIKRALGATQKGIVGEFIAEAALLSALGGIIGVTLATLVTPLFSWLVGDTLFAGITIRWQPLAAFIIFVTIVVLGILMSIFPALHAVKINTIEALRSS